MSTQPTPIIIGPRVGPSVEASGLSDLQRMIDRILSTLSRRRWLFVIPMLSGILLSLTTSLFLPRLYTMSAMFERRDDPVLVQIVQANSPYSFVMMRRSLVLDLMSSDAVKDVADKLRNAPAGSPLAASAAFQNNPAGTVKSILPRIKVTVMEKGQELDLIEMSYTGDKPEFAAQVMNALKDRYIQNVQERIAEILNRSHAFFQEEAQKRKTEMVAMQAELLRVASENPGVSPSQPDLLDKMLNAASQTIDDLARRRGEAATRLAADEEYIAELQRTLSGEASASPLDAGWIPNPRRAELANTIKKIEADITDAIDLKGMTQQHPAVERMRNKLERMREEFDMIPDKTERSALLAQDASGDAQGMEYKRVELEMKTIREQLARFDKELEAGRGQLAKLTRDKSTLEERRSAYAMRRHELERIEADFQAWNSHVGTLARTLTAKSNDRGIHFRTLSHASAPAEPFSPTLESVFLLCAGIGVAIGAAAVFLRETFDRSLRDVGRLKQNLNIPVLEAIGEIPPSGNTNWLSRKLLLPSVACLQAWLLIAVGALVFLNLNQPAVYDRFMASMKAGFAWNGS